MNKEDYKTLIAEGVDFVEDGKGRKHYLKIPSFPDDIDIFMLLKTSKKEISNTERMVRLLCLVLCEEDGSLNFDYDNEEDRKIVQNMPGLVKISVFNKIMGGWFPKKKLEEAS